MKDKVLNLVSAICNEVSTDCRSLNKAGIARELMNLIDIPEIAEIREIPLDWDNQVAIYFKIPNDNNYYGLYAGIGNDNQYFFDLTIIGDFDIETGEFNFYDAEKQIPIDCFCKKEITSTEDETTDLNNTMAQNYSAYDLGFNSPEEMLTLLNILEAHGESLEDIANYTSHAIDNIFNSDITRIDIVKALMECNVFFDGENSDYLQDREADFLESGLASGRIIKTANGYVEINII